jgi:hypothetical protein
MSAHDEWAELAAGYALNALEPEDEQAFTEHLAGCSRCREDLAALHEVTGELAYAADPAEPPAGLGARIMVAATAARPPAPGLSPPSVTPLFGAEKRARFRAPSLAAAAAVVAIAGLGAWNVVLRADGQVRRAALERRERALGCLTADGTAKFRLVAGAASAGTPDPARAAACVSGDRAYVVADRLDPNDARSVYVLWWQDDSDALHAVERFDVAAGGTAVYELPIAAPPSDIKAMAISLEQGRGLPAQPTRRVVSGSRTT